MNNRDQIHPMNQYRLEKLYRDGRKMKIGGTLISLNLKKKRTRKKIGRNMVTTRICLRWFSPEITNSAGAIIKKC